MSNKSFLMQDDALPTVLFSRLQLIMDTADNYWTYCPHYPHFIRQNKQQSLRVHSILKQLACLLPESNRLNSEEWFVVSAAAFLFEIGMQTRKFKPVLDWEIKNSDAFTQNHLLEIWQHRGELSRQEILTNPSLAGQSFTDELAQMIAQVCCWVSTPPVPEVNETQPLHGIMVRLGLLAALLRMADELYVDPDRVDMDNLNRAGFPPSQWARWSAYAYTQIMPLVRGEIRFHYSLPKGQEKYLGSIRALIEPNFEYSNNQTITHLHSYGLSLVPPYRPHDDEVGNSLPPIPPDLLAYLEKVASRKSSPTKESVKKITKKAVEPQELSGPQVGSEESLIPNNELPQLIQPNEQERWTLAVTPQPNRTRDSKVFVSYAWEEESERTVDELEQAFAKRGIRILRDKKDLEYKGSIREFEQRIGRGQCIILVIGDKYLRSEHCMYELLEINRNANMRERIFPIILASAHIFTPIDRLDYISFWKKKIDQLNQAIIHSGDVANKNSIIADLEKYVDIRASFDYLSDLLHDMNALTPELHAANGYSVLISAVARVLAENQESNSSSKGPTQPEIKDRKSRRLSLWENFKGFLGEPMWQGIGALIALIALVITVITVLLSR